MLVTTSIPRRLLKINKNVFMPFIIILLLIDYSRPLAAMSYPVEHKTVFVLDKGPLFARSCKQSIEYDVMSKTKTPGIIPAAPIMKSMWTCNVETLIEYMRVVFDIFPAKRMVSGQSQPCIDLHVSSTDIYTCVTQKREIT